MQDQRAQARKRNGVAIQLVAASALLMGSAIFCLAQAQLPAAQTSNGVEYVTGGFGSDVSSAFREAKSRYPLSLTFAATSDGSGATPYAADVQVDISDEQGKTVLSVPEAGPYLLADLEPGKYTVKATYEGQTKTQDVRVQDDGGADLRFAWERPAVGSERERKVPEG